VGYQSAFGYWCLDPEQRAVHVQTVTKTYWRKLQRPYSLRVDASASNVKVQLADGDGHAVGAEVSKSKHATDVRVRRKTIGVNQQFKQNKS
jgi:hypothetical protein